MESNPKAPNSETGTDEPTGENQYRGFNCKNVVSFLSEEWVQINFQSKHSAFYKLLTESEVGEYHRVPQGNRTKKAYIPSLNNKNFGPRIKYRQHDLPACIYYSLANACAYIGENVAATKLFDVF